MGGALSTQYVKKGPFPPVLGGDWPTCEPRLSFVHHRTDKAQSSDSRRNTSWYLQEVNRLKPKGRAGRILGPPVIADGAGLVIKPICSLLFRIAGRGAGRRADGQAWGCMFRTLILHRRDFSGSNIITTRETPTRLTRHPWISGNADACRAEISFQKWNKQTSHKTCREPSQNRYYGKPELRMLKQVVACR